MLTFSDVLLEPSPTLHNSQSKALASISYRATMALFEFPLWDGRNFPAWDAHFPREPEARDHNAIS